VSWSPSLLRLQYSTHFSVRKLSYMRGILGRAALYICSSLSNFTKRGARIPRIKSQNHVGPSALSQSSSFLPARPVVLIRSCILAHWPSFLLWTVLDDSASTRRLVPLSRLLLATVRPHKLPHVLVLSSVLRIPLRDPRSTRYLARAVRLFGCANARYHSFRHCLQTLRHWTEGVLGGGDVFTTSPKASERRKTSNLEPSFLVKNY